MQRGGTEIGSAELSPLVTAPSRTGANFRVYHGSKFIVEFVISVGISGHIQKLNVESRRIVFVQREE